MATHHLVEALQAAADRAEDRGEQLRKIAVCIQRALGEEDQPVFSGWWLAQAHTIAPPKVASALGELARTLDAVPALMQTVEAAVASLTGDDRVVTIARESPRP